MTAEEVALQRRIPAGFGGSDNAEQLSSAGRCQSHPQISGKGPAPRTVTSTSLGWGPGELPRVGSESWVVPCQVCAPRSQGQGEFPTRLSLPGESLPSPGTPCLGICGVFILQITAIKDPMVALSCLWGGGRPFPALSGLVFLQ